MKGKLCVWSVLSALLLGSGAAFAVGTAVPLMVRSEATDDGGAAGSLASRDSETSALGPRLVATPSGRVVASFERGRFVYLSFAFTTASPKFGIQVVADEPLGSVAVLANGFALRPLSDSPETYTTLEPPSGPISATVRLERGAAARAAVTVRLVSVEVFGSFLPDPAGRVLDQPLRDLEFALAETRGASAADILIPAIVRASGLHGPVRSDVAIANRSAATVNATLQFRGADGTNSPDYRVRLEPGARVKLHDVVRVLVGAEVDAQGVVAIRGIVPASPGDVSAETYYENDTEGRVGTSLPLFFAQPSREGAGILASSTDGDPRLILFSSAAGGTSVARLNVQLGQGAPITRDVSLAGGAYTTARLSELIGTASSDALVTVETDSANVHALFVRSDPVSGSPFVVASN